MKALLCFLTIVLMSMQTFAYTGFGICNFGEETVDDIICYGPAILKKTKINGDVKVAGSLQADGITVERLTIAGDASILTSQVNGLADIVGRLDANGVQFVKDIHIINPSSSLINSKVGGSIRVTSRQQKPNLILACGSVVSGTIIFEGKAGLVQITDDSLIRGKIINGSQEFIQKKCS